MITIYKHGDEISEAQGLRSWYSVLYDSTMILKNINKTELLDIIQAAKQDGIKLKIINT